MPLKGNPDVDTSNTNTLFLPRETVAYMFRSTYWTRGTVNLYGWTLEREGNYLGPGFVQEKTPIRMYKRTMAPGTYIIDNDSAMYLFDEEMTYAKGMVPLNIFRILYPFDAIILLYLLLCQLVSNPVFCFMCLANNLVHGICNAKIDYIIGQRTASKNESHPVQCCGHDGKSCTAPEPCREGGTTYDEAVEICLKQDMRLCTPTDDLHKLCCGKRCSRDHTTMWIEDATKGNYITSCANWEIPSTC